MIEGIMNNGSIEWIEFIALAIMLLLCLPIHEYAHAKSALLLGDSTELRAGRCTLNPFSHIDICGMLMLVFLGFGYAKPVPVNIRNLRKPRRDNVIVSLAGPLSNLLLALFFLLLAQIVNEMGSMFDNGYFCMLIVMCLKHVGYINIKLFVFNLMPLPPLDGYHVLLSCVNGQMSQKLIRMEKYGMYIMLGIVMLFTAINASPITIMTNGVYNAVEKICEALT